MTFVPVPMAPDGHPASINVYHRNDNGKLGRFLWEADKEYKEPHKQAILEVCEVLVANGDGLENKAVLAVIKGGKE